MKQKLLTIICLTILINISITTLAVDYGIGQDKGTQSVHDYKEWGDKNVDFLRFNSQRYTTDKANLKLSEYIFYPVEPWEIEVCSRGLSTQLDNNVDIIRQGGGVYADTATISAYVTLDNDTKNPQHLFEISWYYHPANIEKTYSIYLESSEGIKTTILPDTSADPRMGSFGYKPFYESEKNIKVVLKYDGGLLSVPVINRTKTLK